MSNRIKESNITPGAVTSDKIAPGTISASNITPGTITGTQIATDTIASSNIAPGTIANDRLANTGITINGTTIALGASGDISAGTDWQSVVTADGSTATTASAGEGYFIDTTSNAHTINLPSSPSQGDEVHIVDYAGTFGTNNVTVGRNGSNIDGTAVDGTLATNRLNVRFVYIDSTQGWKAIFDDASGIYGVQYVTATGGTVTESGDFKIHTFTGDGCFVVSCAGNPAGSTSVDYLVVAGGGGGGNGNDNAAGGGAGGFRMSNSTCMSAPLTSPLATPTGLTMTVTTYPVTVGSGGAGTPSQNQGGDGSNSIFSTITSAGGGGGGFRDSPLPGRSGGSGGGGGNQGSTPNPGGAGNTPPVSPPQGNPGGFGQSDNATYSTTGGGGGAGGAGQDSSNPKSGDGGIGSYALSTGFAGCNGTPGPVCGAKYFAGGGGGGKHPARAVGAGSPAGGGGVGGSDPGPVAGAGTANTGGGGGGGSSGVNPQNFGAAGGKGIVIIRYKYQN